MISYQNEREGDVFSGIERKAEFELPDSAFRSDSDTLVGFNMLYDGFLVFTTKQGMVGVVQRDFDESTLRAIPLSEDDEEISNTMAVDENGGIYIVSSKQMYRAQWDGVSLSIAWTADYNAGSEEIAAGRLGAGSGSAPSLMGTGSQDRFVVITDGASLMNIVLFWRDEIPDDWEPIAQGKDRRIAAELPVTFGHPNAIASVSEQSVLVRGYGAVVVNNDYGYSLPLWIPEIARQLLSMALSGIPGIRPYGVEKFVWNPATRILNTAWSTDEISCPNGIPTMSVATNLFYCVGHRLVWNIEALDWDTGESVFHKRTGWLPCYNSGYAALEIGENRELITGTLGGVLRFRLGTDWWT